MGPRPAPRLALSDVLPSLARTRRRARNGLWARLDSNQGPTDYESAALTAELRARFVRPSYRENGVAETDATFERVLHDARHQHGC